MASKKPGARAPSASPLRSVSPLHSLPAAVEWVGGTFPMPTPVSEGSGPGFRPEAAVWVSEEGPLGLALGLDGQRPEECLLDAFAQATTQPMQGAPRRPDRVRVASGEVAEWLRPRLGDDVVVVCGPTPEIDLMRASLGEFLAAQPPEREASFLDHASTPAQIASLFEAAAALFRASPWAVIPDDASALSVTCEPLGLRRAAVSVIGQLGESLGFLCFDTMAAFAQYLDVASESASSGGGLPEGLPAHIALGFEPGAELEPALRKEVSKHRWEVAAATAYPSLYAIEDDLTLRPLTRPEVLRLEVISRALAELVTTAASGLTEAWGDGEPVVRTLTVASSEGPFEVTLRAPHEDDGGLGRMDPLVERRDADGALDDDWYDEHREFLLDAFGASPEAAALAEGGLAPLFLDLAAQHLDATLLSLTPGHVSRMLFELVPRKVSAPSSIAPLIVDELRALLSFARRAFGLAPLDACLRSLTDATAPRLARAMADPSHAGLIKSM
ncbi:MAG: hypothetical protein EOO75_00125, partial [Myxococcales bacterium]